VCLLAREASLRAPLTTAATGLYVRMWSKAFHNLGVWQIPQGEHYEALEGAQIDDLERQTRARIGKRASWRTLTGIECPGSHHGEPVTCRYAAPTPHLAIPASRRTGTHPDGRHQLALPIEEEAATA
jgi:hypothetical protein